MEILNRDCLGEILRFLQPHEWLIGRFVCRRWWSILRQKPFTVSSRHNILMSFRASLELFRWAFQNGCPIVDLATCMYKVCANGSLDIMQFADSTLVPIWSYGGRYTHFWRWADLEVAIEHNHIPIVQWLHSIQGVSYEHHSAMIIAAVHNHDEMIKFLYFDGCPWSLDVCRHLVNHRNLSMLQWVRAHGCPWDRSTCFIFADPEIREWILTQPE